MAKRNDYIFYEADAMQTLVNPFVDINVDDVGKAFLLQRPLKVTDRANDVDNSMLRKFVIGSFT